MSTYDRDNLEEAVKNFFYAMRNIKCSGCPIGKPQCFSSKYSDNCEEAIVQYYIENEEELG